MRRAAYRGKWDRPRPTQEDPPASTMKVRPEEDPNGSRRRGAIQRSRPSHTCSRSPSSADASWAVSSPIAAVEIDFAIRALHETLGEARPLFEEFRVGRWFSTRIARR